MARQRPKEENVKSYVFRVILEPDEEAWRAYIFELEEKGGATWGKTKEEALGNIREVAQMVNAFTRGQIRKASQLHAKFYPLFKDLFIETNPVPVKAALAMMGVIKEEYRLPLVPMSGINRAKLRATLEGCGILK